VGIWLRSMTTGPILPSPQHANSRLPSAAASDDEYAVSPGMLGRRAIRFRPVRVHFRSSFLRTVRRKRESSPDRCDFV
jgi:hypothetical protein